MNRLNVFFVFFLPYSPVMSQHIHIFFSRKHFLRICRICLRFKFPLLLKTEIKEKETNL